MSTPEINPIVLTTLGRTGSNLLAGLLGEHPSIVTYEPQRVESRYASYWVQIFLSMSDKRSAINPLRQNLLYGHKKNIFDESNTEEDIWKSRFSPKEVKYWFAGNYINELREFCLQSISQYYRKVSDSQNKKNVCFFCEKFLPDPFTKTFLRIIPSSVEIFLVRDFRDMLCSIFAFNEKRGTVQFGREKFTTDKEYVIRHVGPAVEDMRRSWKKRKKDSILVKYEDLITNTQNEIKKIFQYIGIDYSDEIVRKTLYQAERKMPEAQKAHKTCILAENSIGRYKRELPKEMDKLCYRVFGDALKCFGYDS